VSVDSVFIEYNPVTRHRQPLRSPLHPVSDLNSLFSDFFNYRLDIMEQRIRRAREDMWAHYEASRPFDTLGHKAFLEECIAFFVHTNSELVGEDEVQRGFVETNKA
jgi:hypothetical protein